MDDVLVNRQSPLPKIPDDIPESLKQYLTSLNNIVGENNRKTFDTLSSISDTNTDTFTGLTDTPSSYATAANKLVSVNAASTGLEFITATDEKVKASTNDTTASYLGSKVTAGNVIALTTVNSGANEQIQIQADINKTVTWYIGGDQTAGSNMSAYVVVPFEGTITRSVAYAKTAPTGANMIFDINKNGTTIWTTQANRLTVTAGSTSASQTSFDVIAVTSGDALSLDVDQVGSSTAGGDVTVQLNITFIGT